MSTSSFKLTLAGSQEINNVLDSIEDDSQSNPEFSELLITNTDVEEVLGQDSDHDDISLGDSVHEERESDAKEDYSSSESVYEEEFRSSSSENLDDDDEGVRSHDAHLNKTEVPVRTARPGRKKDDVWDHFQHKLGTKNVWSCKTCEWTSRQPKADRLRKHLSIKCKKERPIPVSKLCPTDNSFTDMQNGTSASFSAVEVVGLGKKTGSLKHNQTNIKSYFAQTSDATQKELNNKLEMFICSSNVPFRVIENPYFIEFIKALRPSYKLPSAKVASTSLLEELYKNTEGKVTSRIKGQKATIMQDGWTTSKSEAVIAHSLQVKLQHIFVEAIVTEEKKKTAAVCLDWLKSSIDECEKKYEVKIVGCVTDNCATMNAMRRDLMNQREWIITYGCNSHLFNLIGKKMTPEEVKEKVVKVQKYFRNHDFASARLKQLNGLRPVIPGDTRWNSQLDCFRSYLRNQAKYLEISREDSAMPGAIKEVLNDPTLFTDIQKAFTVLEPIAKSVDTLQKDSSTVADAVSCWIRTSTEVGVHAKNEYFKDQYEKGTPDSSIAAYIIHPKYRGEGLCPKMRDAGRLWLSQRNNDNLIIILALSAKDEQFFSSTLFNEAVIANLSPTSWWKTAQADSDGKISLEFLDLCDTLLQLPSSTAGIERSFSKLSQTITDTRNRLGVEKARRICFINQNLQK